MSSLAQEEADRFFSHREHHTSHPEDRLAQDSDTGESLSDTEADPTTHAYTHSDQDDDEDSLHKMTTAATSTAAYYLPNTYFDANTGPKGVISDAHSFDQARKRSFRKTLATLTNAYSNTTSSTPPQQLTSNEEKRSAENSGSELEASDDEEFMKVWRQNRLKELSAGASAGQRRQSPSKRKWGSFDAVDANGYLDAVEKVANDVVVVVCIYDPESNVSAAVEDSLSLMARKHASTRFIKLHHEVAEMDHVGVPAILAYKGGDVFAIIPDCRPEGLETTLRRNGILS